MSDVGRGPCRIVGESQRDLDLSAVCRALLVLFCGDPQSSASASLTKARAGMAGSWQTLVAPHPHAQGDQSTRNRESTGTWGVGWRSVLW